MKHVDQALQVLYQVGFADDGQTRESSYKLITVNAYPLAGAVVTTGGRKRLSKGDVKVTVGKRSTCFYVVQQHEAQHMMTVKTSEVTLEMVVRYLVEHEPARTDFAESLIQGIQLDERQRAEISVVALMMDHE